MGSITSNFKKPAAKAQKINQTIPHTLTHWVCGKVINDCAVQTDVMEIKTSQLHSPPSINFIKLGSNFTTEGYYEDFNVVHC